MAAPGAAPAPTVAPREAPPDRTGILVPPPVVYAAGFAIGWWLDVRTEFSAGSPLPFVGLALVAAAVALIGWAFASFRAARTTVLPHGGTTAIVETGPYAWTRNPMYVAMALAYVGGAFLVGRVGPLLVLPLVLAWIDRRVIAREEAYLERKFGDAYRRYRDRVRRWA